MDTVGTSATFAGWLGFDWQLAAVVAVTAVAAWYTGRAFLRQFRRADDEAAGCASCPAASAARGERADQTPAGETSKSTTASSSAR